MSQDHTRWQVGAVVDGQYRIISEGEPQNLWTLYIAYDSRHDRLAVLSLLARQPGSGPERIDRLIRANQAVAGLEHPSLLPYEHIGHVDGQTYLVRAYVSGQSLAGLLRQMGFLEPEAAVDIAMQVCQALAPAHRAGLVHGGLSPHSVILDDDGRVWVADTGLLPALRPAATRRGEPWGRFPYLSPEQAAGREAQPASDVYHIGLLLYEMLTGRPPFVAADETALAAQILGQDPVPLQSRVPQVPLALAEIVHRALAREAARRYRNAGQLAHILGFQLGPDRVVGSSLGRYNDLGGPPIVPPPTIGRGGLDESRTPVLDADEWVEDPPGVDWLMIALLVVALAAVLGLIPLWRTVHDRYTAPPTATPAMGVTFPTFHELPRFLEGAELEKSGLPWYNFLVEVRRECELENRTSLSYHSHGSRGAVPGSLSEWEPAG